MRSLSREFIPKGDYQQRRYEIYEKQCTGTGHLATRDREL